MLAGGLPIDSGPTVLTMRWVFDELAREAGFSLGDFVSCKRARTIARHGWSDGARLDLFAAALAAFLAQGVDPVTALVRSCGSLLRPATATPPAGTPW